MSFPVIETLKKHTTHFNAEQQISLDPNSAFGNLNLNWMEIVIRIECVNDLIITLYSEFENLQTQFKLTQTGTLDQLYRQKLYTEQIVYWLRKTADELISLIYVLSYFKKEGKYPKKILIGSIGDLLKSDNPFNGDFDRYKSSLRSLNEISNGFKHSFINSQIHAYHGSEYPVVFAYTLHYNDRSNQAKFYTLDLRQVLNDYGRFLEFTKTYIKDNFELQSKI